MTEQAAIYIPENRPAWRGGLDKRTRCAHCGKVVFPSQEKAEASAAKAAARETRQDGKVMQAYLGKCGHWHVGHGRKKSLPKAAVFA